VACETPNRLWFEWFFQVTEGIGVVVMETTDVKVLQEQLRQAQKMEAVGRLAAGVAHDFNNQLTVIQGYGELLLKDRREGDPLWECLTQIQRAAKRAASTTSHLLSFSRREGFHPETVDLAELLREVQRPISRLIGEDIELTVVAPPGVPSVCIDKAGLHQVIINLVVNARDAMPNGGKLILRTSCVKLGPSQAAEYPGAAEGTYVRLEVIDSGAGMDRQTLERAFDPFFTTKEPGKGTGLGLPMVMGFVRQNQGFISIQSQVGKGTAARLLLPPSQSRAHTVQSALSPTLGNGQKGHTIMVVEDEDGVRGLFVRALERDGYRVLAASGPTQALQLSQEHRGAIDLLIADMIMPEMNGDELAARLKSARQELRVLYITGYSEINVRPGDNLLRKPISVADLLTCMSSLLSQQPLRGRQPA
jgi:signal transduction histidine kinase